MRPVPDAGSRGVKAPGPAVLSDTLADAQLLGYRKGALINRGAQEHAGGARPCEEYMQRLQDIGAEHGAVAGYRLADVLVSLFS
jgi:hypothetical protein